MHTSTPASILKSAQFTHTKAGRAIFIEKQDVCSASQFDDRYIRKYPNWAQTQLCIKLIASIDIINLHDKMSEGCCG